jgi:hypothetical protein
MEIAGLMLPKKSIQEEVSEHYECERCKDVVCRFILNLTNSR